MNATPVRSAPVAAAAPNAVSALTAVATPSAPDRPAQHDAGAPRRFAELLRQSRSERAAPAAAAHAEPAMSAASRPPGETDERTDTETSAAPAPRSAPPAKARAPIAKGATGKASVDRASALARPVANDAERDANAVATVAPTATGERAASLLALAAAAATDAGGRCVPTSSGADQTGDASVPSSDGAAENSLSAVSRDDARRGAGHARGEAVVDAADGHVALAAASTARATSTLVDPAFHASLGDAVRAVEAPASSRGTLATEAAAASLAAGSATRMLGEPQGIAAAPATLALATPIDASDFAAALGIQVSLLAHDGVQHAELHLHPAETGPVSIHIAVDGNAARVDFGADHAATRQAIERGLPELASALRDAGLTLTGGSVSQHAGSRQSGDDGETAAQERPDGAGGAPPIATTARIPRRSAAGGVDLYA